MYACMYVYMYVCMYMYVCICMYVQLPVFFFFPQTLLCNSMSHKELVIYVDEYVVKNYEALKPITLSLQALCWPHMGKLDEVNK